MGLALAVACYRERRRAGDLVWLGLGAAPAALALLAFNTATLGHPLGVHVTQNVGVAPWHAPASLLSNLGAILAGYGGNPLEAVLLPAGLVAAWWAGGRAAQRERGLATATAIAVGLALLAWGRGAVQIATAGDAIYTLTRYNGFLVQMPAVALAGMGAVLVGRRAELAPLRGGVTAGLVFLALGVVVRVTLTDFQAGVHWGPRMLLPAAPALAALALVAVRDGVVAQETARIRVAQAAGAALVVAGLVSSALAVTLLREQKLETQRIQRLVRAAPQALVVTDHPALGQQLAAIWGEKPLLLAPSRSDLRRLTRSLHARGVEEFLYLRRPSRDHEPDLDETPRCRRVGRHRGQRIRHVLDLDVYTCTPT